MPKAHVITGKADLSKIPTGEDGGLDKDAAKPKIKALQEELYELQELMYAAGETSLLIVLQGMDTSGKEGAIGAISAGINVHGVKVAPFKAPTEEERAHDFLWRIRPHAPAKGMVAIFNRSHYEDVVITRVHNWITKDVWTSRYEHIRSFERLLLDNNTIILKFFLHISKEEQEERLKAREEDPVKAWKLNVGDWKERAYWDDYQKAYEDALRETSIEGARWHVVPSDHKWYRNLVVLETVVDALKPMRKKWVAALEKTGQEAMKEIEEFRKAK